MYLLIIFLPLFSSLSLGFYGRYLGFYGSGVISLSCLSFSFLISLLMFYEIGLDNHVVFIDLFYWILSDDIFVRWNFLFDNLTSAMLIIVTFISFLVHLYSVEYMKLDPHFPRFMSFLSIFTFFMLVLITAGNIIQLFIGWEGVGLASYLLINFWFTRLNANKAALKALIINRVGDLGILMVILLLILGLGGSTDFLFIFSITPLVNNFYIEYFYTSYHYLSIVCFFLILGAVGKSAQLGLHTWLPDAMEGPTPVSALIHAATMVTAGVFVVIRFSPVIEFSPVMLNFLIIAGSFTAFFAAFTGIFQHDLKKVIAYSTCSQLGYMIFCCGLSCYNISFFHLFNHAFFKALLFLSAGSVIHSLNNEQDMRRMGSVILFLPLTYSVMLIGSLALTGFPFLTGFYSKDVILEVAATFWNNNTHSNFGSLACWLGILSAFFTSFYSFRLLYLTFLNNTNTTKSVLNYSHESSFFIILPLIILAILSIFVGYFFKDFFIGLGNPTWNNVMFFWPRYNYHTESEFLFIFSKWVPFLFTLGGFLVASFFHLFSFYSVGYIKNLNFLFFVISKKWFFDFFYNKFIVYTILNFGYMISYKNIDRGFLELIGPVGLTSIVKKKFILLSSLQTGQLTHYIFFIFISFLIFSNMLFIQNSYVDLLVIFFISLFYLI